MNTQIKTTHGTYSGKTADTIIRREYGPKAVIMGDRIVTHTKNAEHKVEADLHWIDNGTTRQYF